MNEVSTCHLWHECNHSSGKLQYPRKCLRAESCSGAGAASAVESQSGEATRRSSSCSRDWEVAASAISKVGRAPHLMLVLCAQKNGEKGEDDPEVILPGVLLGWLKSVVGPSGLQDVRPTLFANAELNNELRSEPGEILNSRDISWITRAVQGPGLPCGGGEAGSSETDFTRCSSSIMLRRCGMRLLLERSPRISSTGLAQEELGSQCRATCSKELH